MNGPPTRREIRRQEREQAILDVARESFLKEGYAATSMSAIAGALGGSKTTLWSYFPSKEALFAAVLEAEIGRFREALIATLSPSGTIEDTLRTFSTALLGKLTRPDTLRLHRIIASEVERFPEIGRIFYERAPKQTHQRLAGYLEDAMARGELRRADPLLAAQQLVALLQARVYPKRVWGVDAASNGTIAEEVEAALDTFLRAYAPER
ncbi:TetR/AcrR family transcriptional regulator [Sphingosinicella sp. BN140058]|uniref:TetR/AcrR family transcriptional regulator n=1 Tax=Sphingosinicella sp. BN140058 TaxID=1892855 RepID=UPI0010124D01|nr:TetR/AcrR family transcriptional regulator [Sphingosinicella sp. BN140058]QAY75861.1 TetR/AcrR family transcriptional regulator [Sphingosinicella sp. BN140058]